MPKLPARWIWQRPHWPQLSWDQAALAAPLSHTRRLQGELLGLARLLDPKQNLAAQLEVMTLEGIKTSAIEGENLDPRAVRSSLARRLGLPTGGCSVPPVQWRAWWKYSSMQLKSTIRH